MSTEPKALLLFIYYYLFNYNFSWKINHQQSECRKGCHPVLLNMDLQSRIIGFFGLLQRLLWTSVDPILLLV